MHLWYTEEAYYDYDTHSQKSGFKGQMIGHFTQLVWAATRKVGCGVASCGSNGMPFVNVVCQFYEAGRYSIGSRRELCNVHVSLCLPPLKSHPSHLYHHLVYSSAGNYAGHEPFNVFPRNETAIITT